MTVNHSQFAALKSVGADTAQGLAQVAGAIKQQAFMQATDDFSWLSGCVFVMLLALIWLARRNAPVAAAAAEAGH